VYTINRVVQVRGGELEANIKAIISEGALGATTKQVLESIAAEKERMGVAALNSDLSLSEFKQEVSIEMVDVEGIPGDVLDKLKVFFPY
jgi:dihydroxyacetone kinase DhaKLM complex PTS-EIIA-like component DhaM